MRLWRQLRIGTTWALGAVLVLCLGIGGVTSRWFIEWRSPDRSRDTGFLAWKGMVEVSWGPAIPGFYIWEPPVGLSAGRERSRLVPMPPWRWKPDWISSPFGTGVSIPLWLPGSLSLAGLLALSWVDRRTARRERVGRCQRCGYDRAGIAMGVKCPECGKLPIA